MGVINLLASQQGHRGSEANITLARQIAETDNKTAIKELVENLSNKDKRIQSDCIKVLYETGYIKPELIAGYAEDFIGLLKSKNNRLVWGAMVALATLTELNHQKVFASLNAIYETIQNGSVITVDAGIELLAKLNKHDVYSGKTEPLLIEQFWKCPIKQLPQYIEKSMICINKKNEEIFINIIEKRKPECTAVSQVKRLDKALKQLMKVV
ncbi:MAG: hypothetical protein K9H26_06115 [Prolixibacteraceae bacterium]|nr:hypothetical protein [Prolixibacteraceae bacterium]